MIRINLIRQCQPSLPPIQSSWVGFGIGGLLLLLAGLGSAWWTHIVQIERERLLLEHTSTIQNLSQLQGAIERRSQVKAQTDGLIVTWEKIKAEVPFTPNSADFMKNIGEGLHNLQVWLDSIQIEAGTVEIHGKAYVIGDVGKFLDRLEIDLPLRGFPLVEIQEGDNEPSAPYSFLIRFVVKGQAVP